MYIQITPNSVITADYLASLRLNYEYKREGYDYGQIAPASWHINNFFGVNLITTPSNIPIGILAELLIYKDLTLRLCGKNSSMIQEFFQYHLTIGAYDKGFDIVKNDKKIDIKCYAKRIITSPDELSHLNLLVDKEQYETESRADLYIQTFIMPNINGLFLYVAGYAESNGLLLNEHFPKPAYCCPVNNLHSYDELKQKYF